MRAWTLLAATLLLPVTACGGGSDAKRAATVTVEGSVAVSGATDTLSASPGDPCISGNGYDDINEGATVAIRNSDDKQVAVGSLKGGTVTADNLSCNFTFRVPEVPKDVTYTVTIGGRDPYPFNARQAGNLNLMLN